MSAPPEITPKEWTRIVAVYAKHNARLSSVALELGWPIARTTRRYKLGYPSLGYPPIQMMLAKDAFSADEIRAERALVERTLPPSAPLTSRAQIISNAEGARIRQMVHREEERERVRQDSIKSRAEEATLVSINRRNAIALNAMTAQVLRGATALSSNIQRELEREAAGGKLTLTEKLHLVRAVASVARFNAEATVMAVKAERLVLGAPIDAGAEGTTEESGSLDEAAAWIEACGKALQRARSRGLIAAGGS